MKDQIQYFQSISDRLQLQIDNIKHYKKTESEIGSFLKENASMEIIKFIPLDEAYKFVLLDGMQLLNALNLAEATYLRWQKRIDNRIIELKEEEFPSEINL